MAKEGERQPRSAGDRAAGSMATASNPSDKVRHIHTTTTAWPQSILLG